MTQTAVITPLPVWKKAASAEERFLELAHMAQAHPEKFQRVAVVWDYDVPQKDGSCTQRTAYVTAGVDTVGALGLLELGKDALLTYVNGR